MANTFPGTVYNFPTANQPPSWGSLTLALPTYGDSATTHWLPFHCWIFCFSDWSMKMLFSPFSSLALTILPLHLSFKISPLGRVALLCCSSSHPRKEAYILLCYHQSCYQVGHLKIIKSGANQFLYGTCHALNFNEKQCPVGIWICTYLICTWMDCFLGLGKKPEPWTLILATRDSRRPLRLRCFAHR